MTGLSASPLIRQRTASSEVPEANPLTFIDVQKRISGFFPDAFVRLSCSTSISLAPYILPYKLYESFQSSLGYEGSYEQFREEFCSDSREKLEMNILQFALKIKWEMSPRRRNHALFSFASSRYKMEIISLKTPPHSLEMFSPSYRERIKAVLNAQGATREETLYDLTREYDRQFQPKMPTDQAIEVTKNNPISVFRKKGLEAITKRADLSSEDISQVIEATKNLLIHDRKSVLDAIAKIPNLSPIHRSQMAEIAEK